jgi:hypothetical protein
MDRVYKGNELEVKMFGRWTELPSDCEYRIKPEVVHYNKNIAFYALCGNHTAAKSTDDRSKVTCPDCLAKMLPDWVKVGAKCFWNQSNKKDGLYEIKSIDNGFATIESKISIVTTTIKSLTPAVRHAPTCAELAKYMPLCLKLKGEGNLYRTALSMNAESVVILEKLSSGGCVEVKIADLHEKYTYADGAEIGDWRKA